jgi:hypothetical protein
MNRQLVMMKGDIMKKALVILSFLLSAVIINGCEQTIYNSTYRVSAYNNNDDLYMTELYFRSYSYGNGGWSRNLLNNDLEPYESFSIILDEGTYDFEIVLEDDDYIYTIHEEYVDIYYDMVLDVCYDCYLKDNMTKVVKKEKKVNGETSRKEKTDTNDPQQNTGN